MREIKFRVWNGSAYEYDVMVGKFGAFYVNPMNNGLDATDSASLSPFNTKFSDGVVVEQFTGLHDKNGVEIYEGDIVNHDFFGKREIVWGNKKLSCLSDQSAFMLDGTSAFVSGSDSERLEVIGNIHEHKELNYGV